MKKIFLALLAVVAMVACEDNLEGKSGEATEFDFAFNEAGECYSTKTNGISASVFAEQVVGYGWKALGAYEIYEDGSVSTQNYWRTILGAYAPNLYFESNEKVIEYSRLLDKYRYLPVDYVFDDSKIFYAGKRNFYKYLILKVDEDSMECMKKFQDFYGLVVFQRMTAEELEESKEKHTVEIDYESVH